MYVIGGAAALLLLLIIFGKTVNPNKPVESVANNSTAPSFDYLQISKAAKDSLPPTLQKKIIKLEQEAQSASDANKIDIYTHLATLWKDSVSFAPSYLFYTAEAAKLENSEKSLTFAAQQFVDNLLSIDDPSIQNWLATQAKVLFDKALVINANNDSSKIGLGACYIFGNISNNPMTGILPVREIATKNPNNLYAQLVLGLGGKKSGQFDKAIERFLIIANQQPSNIVVCLHLAECYEQKGDKKNATVWYTKAKDLVKNPQIIGELELRIKELNK